MGHPRRNLGDCEACRIVDFDEALLDSYPAQLRAEVMTEAELLVGVFAPDRRPDRLDRMAAQLSSGERDGEMNRAHARRLAAALRRIAREAEHG